MDPSTALLLEISLAVGAVACLCGYGMYWLKKPKNFLIVLNGSSYLPVRIKKAGATTQAWVDPKDKEKRPINFKLDPSFSYQDRKGGLRYMGDPKTGLLVRFNAEACDFQYMDPRYPIQALNDGRPLQIVRTLKGEPFYTQYILPALIVVGLLSAAILFFVYKMYSASRGGG